MIVDAHHHLWDPAARRHAWLDALPQLRRPFGIREFSQLAAAHSVTASVLVQVLASARRRPRSSWPWPAARRCWPGVVGWADLTAPGIGDELARLRQLPGGDRLAGIRHLVQDEPDPDWLRPAGRAPRAARGGRRRAGLRPAGPAGAAARGHLAWPATSATSASCWTTAAKPDIAHGQPEPWSTLIGELAAAPNVSCKLSGLVTEAGPGWTAGADHPVREPAAGLLRAGPADVRLGLAGVHAGRGLRRRAAAGRHRAGQPARARPSWTACWPGTPPVYRLDCGRLSAVQSTEASHCWTAGDVHGGPGPGHLRIVRGQRVQDGPVLGQRPLGRAGLGQPAPDPGPGRRPG